MTAAQPTISGSAAVPVAQRRRVATPAILFGLRLWASVCLALWVAFTLELSEPSWAATTAALVCQPVLGASLRKSMFRLVGTVIGAVAIVVLAAICRQDRVAFLVGLTVWCAASAFVATMLRNFAAYAAALAGYTAAIIAIDALGPVGSTNGIVFMFAVDRALEICIGIVSAEVMLALTDLGHSRRKLAAELSALSSGVMDGFTNAFAANIDLDQYRGLRRDLLRRVIALDPMIDAAIGESSDLRYRSAILQRAVSGVMETLSAWRKVAFTIALHGDAATPREVGDVHDLLPQAHLSSGATASPEATVALRQACCSAVRSLTRFDAQTPMQRLLADNAAAGMLGMARALNGLAGVLDSRAVVRVKGRARLHVADWAPAFVNAIRTLLAVGAISLFWIVSAWPNGVEAITFCAVIVILLSLQGDAAYSASMTFLWGTTLSAVAAAAVAFGILPKATTFPSLCLVLGLVLVPFGFLIALPWRHSFLFTAATFNFVPMLNITNGMNYDGSQFWNGAIAIIAGIGVGAVAMLVIPPLSPEIRAQRLLSLMLKDLRRVSRRARPGRQDDWEHRGVGRLLAMPDQADSTDRAALAAIVAVGKEVVRLRHIAPRFVPAAAVDSALKALAEGRSRDAIARLRDIDRQAAALPRARSRIVLNLRAGILAITGQLSVFAPYFDRPVR